MFDENLDDGKKICCICKKSFVGYGHNPYPVKEKGRCCSECNELVVQPRRRYVSQLENDIIWAINERFLKVDKHHIVTKKDVVEVCEMMEVDDYDNTVIKDVLNYFFKEHISKS